MVVPGFWAGHPRLARGSQVVDARTRSPRMTMETLDEHEVAHVHRGGVGEGDHLVVAVKSGVDLPLGGVELGEGRALRRGAEAQKLEAVATRSAIAGEVEDRVAIGLAGSEHEGVITGI